MPLPSSPPITLSQIQSEFSAANLQAASTAAGLDPLPTSMLDFLGLSAYTMQTYTYLTPGTYYFTVPANKPDGLMNVLCIGAGGGGGGSIAGSGYNGEPGGFSAAAGGGGGGGALAAQISDLYPVVPGQTITIIVGAGGAGSAGYDPESFGVYTGSPGDETSVDWNISGYNADKVCRATGGLGGRNFNSKFRYSAPLTNGTGGDSGIATNFRSPGTLYAKPGGAGYAGNIATDLDVDHVTGGGGGGAGSPATGTIGQGGIGDNISLTGVSNLTYGAAGNGGAAYGGANPGDGANGANGANVGMGGGGGATYVFRSRSPAVTHFGGNGAQGGVQIYV